LIQYERKVEVLRVKSFFTGNNLKIETLYEIIYIQYHH